MPVKNGPFQPFDPIDWWCETMREARRRVKAKERHFDTSQFRRHMLNARKEQLLAVRSLIDSGIEFIEGKERKTPPPSGSA